MKGKFGKSSSRAIDAFSKVEERYLAKAFIGHFVYIEFCLGRIGRYQWLVEWGIRVRNFLTFCYRYWKQSFPA